MSGNPLALVIRPVVSALYGDELVKVWKSSVQATHTFVSRSDLAAIEADLRETMPNLPGLHAAFLRNEEIGGFMGVEGNSLQMLFVAAPHQRQGIGRSLLRRALALGVSQVDVNEQNVSAAAFYRRHGFVSIGTSSRDGQGRAYPISHMTLAI